MSDLLDQPAQSTDLIIPSALVPAVIFAKGGADDVLAQLRNMVATVKTDISTPKGRAAVKSLAYKIARSKTALDDMGKNLSDQLRAQIDPILEERRKIREGCDALKDEVTAPLDAWEAQEAERIKAHEDALVAISRTAEFFSDEPTSADIAQRIEQLDELTLAPYNWQEFIQRAIDAKASARATLEDLLSHTVAREEREAEAARVAAEQEAARLAELARLQAEREAEIARQAAEQARLAAEAEAARQAEEARIAAEAEAQRVAEVARIERERIQREADEAAEAARVERKRIEDAAAEREEQHRREQQRMVDEAAAIDAARREEQRVDYIRRMIQHIVDCGNGFMYGEPQPLMLVMRELEEKIVIDETFGEFRGEAVVARDTAMKKLRDFQDKQAERDRKIEAEKEAAIEAERGRVAAQQEHGRREQAAREADKKHRAQVNTKARDALISRCGLDVDQATAVIRALASGQVPGAKIEY